MPDVRLARIAERILLGILGGQSPIVTCMARQSSKDEGETWAAAKKIYRWLENERFDSQNLSVSLYEIGQGGQRSRWRTWLWRLPRSTSRNRMSAWFIRQRIHPIGFVATAMAPAGFYRACPLSSPLACLSLFCLLAPFPVQGIHLWVIASLNPGCTQLSFIQSLKPQLFQNLAVTLLSLVSQQIAPEIIVIPARTDRQRHRNAPAQQQDFFFGLQPR